MMRAAPILGCAALTITAGVLFGPLAAFYHAAASIAFFGTYRRGELVWLGAAIIANFWVSNTIWSYASFETRLGPYSMLGILVIGAAYHAFSVHRKIMLLCVVTSSAMSITANMVFASIPLISISDVRSHETITNACFFFECIFAAASGAGDEWLNRIRRMFIRGDTRRSTFYRDAGGGK